MTVSTAAVKVPLRVTGTISKSGCRRGQPSIQGASRELVRPDTSIPRIMAVDTVSALKKAPCELGPVKPAGQGGWLGQSRAAMRIHGSIRMPPHLIASSGAATGAAAAVVGDVAIEVYRVPIGLRRCARAMPSFGDAS